MSTSNPQSTIINNTKSIHPTTTTTQTTTTKQKKMTRNRLPTLQEVLARQTRPPVDLYCFYLYLQRERAEDSLDFWLDAQQHENLCKAYFKDLRKSEIQLKDEWPAYYDKAKMRGSVYNQINGITRQSKLLTEPIRDPVSKVRRSGSASRLSNSRTPIPGPQLAPHVSPAVRALFPHDNPDEEKDDRRKSGGLSRPGTSHLKNPTQPVIPRSSAITRTDLIASAERIYYRYLLSGAEKEIYLPSSLRIPDFPINSNTLPHAGSEDYEFESDFLANVPDLFVSQKEYIYRSMEQDTFPRFLRSKAFGNLTPLSALVRLCVGLLTLWIGLSIGFSMIFLDAQPRSKRFWILIPFMMAILGIVSHFYDLDPILILFNRSETTPFRTLRVKEKYVQKILRGRAIWVTILSVLGVVILGSIFISVPGHRL